MSIFTQLLICISSCYIQVIFALEANQWHENKKLGKQYYHYTGCVSGQSNMTNKCHSLGGTTLASIPKAFSVSWFIDELAGTPPNASCTDFIAFGGIDTGTSVSNWNWLNGDRWDANVFGWRGGCGNQGVPRDTNEPYYVLYLSYSGKYFCDASIEGSFSIVCERDITATDSPSLNPTKEPTMTPSNVPTLSPSTNSHTMSSSDESSTAPTNDPITISPTHHPSDIPTLSPFNTSLIPSVSPTQNTHTGDPTQNPSNPTVIATIRPPMSPTVSTYPSFSVEMTTQEAEVSESVVPTDSWIIDQSSKSGTNIDLFAWIAITAATLTISCLILCVFLCQWKLNKKAKTKMVNDGISRPYNVEKYHPEDPDMNNSEEHVQLTLAITGSVESANNREEASLQSAPDREQIPDNNLKMNHSQELCLSDDARSSSPRKAGEASVTRKSKSRSSARLSEGKTRSPEIVLPTPKSAINPTPMI